jgi:hypothetical protein
MQILQKTGMMEKSVCSKLVSTENVPAPSMYYVPFLRYSFLLIPATCHCKTKYLLTFPDDSSAFYSTQPRIVARNADTDQECTCRSTDVFISSDLEISILCTWIDYGLVTNDPFWEIM